MAKKLSWFLAIVVVLSVLAGCSSPAAVPTQPPPAAEPTKAPEPVQAEPTKAPAAQPEPTKAPAAQPEPTKAPAAQPAPVGALDHNGEYYAIAAPFLSLDYYEEYKRAMALLQEEMPGVKIELLGPSGFDIEATNTAMDQAVAKGAKGIIMMPWEATQGPAIDRAVEAGVPVLTLGVDLPSSKRLGYIGTSNFAAGQKAADWLAARMNGKGKLAMMRTPALANVTERVDGFKARMKEKYPDIQIVADLDHQNDSNIGAQQLVAALQKDPDITGVFAADGISGPAAAMGAREAGLPKGQVQILGFDREDSLLQAIEDGDIAGTVVQGSFLEAYLGIKVLDMLNHGLAQTSYDDKAAKVRLVPEMINPGVVIADKDNVKYFRRGYADQVKAPQPRTDWTGEYYAIAAPFLSLDYYEEYKRAMALLQEEMPGVKIELLGPSGFDIEATNTAMDQAVAKGAKGIIMMPWEATQGPAIDRAVEAGVPVLTLGVDLPSSKRLGYIGTSNFAAGQKAADWLAARMNGKGKMAMMRTPALANVTERVDGFKARMKEKYPDIQIVADLDHQNDSNIGAQQLVAALQKDPDITGVFAADGISGPAAAMGAREAGLPKGQVQILGFDREDSLLQAIEDGDIAGTVVQGSFLEAYLGIKVLDMLNQGLAQTSYDDKAAGITLVPEMVNPSVVIADKDNVKYFRRNYKP